MSRPLPPTEALDAQERELARIVRALPGGEPPAALDARILKSAANAAASSRAPRARWLASTGALWGIGGAAAAVLALGVSWQMMYGAPRPHQPASSAVPTVDQADDGSVAVEFKDRQPQAGSNAPLATGPVAAPTSPALARPPPARPRIASSSAPAPPPPAETPVPEAFSDQHLDEHVAGGAEVGVSAEAAVAATAADAQGDAGGASAAKVMAGTAQERPVTRAQAAGALGEPSAADAIPSRPMKPATWLAHIRRLRDQHRPAEARASLLEFQRRYPELVIPSDLAPLLRQ